MEVEILNKLDDDFFNVLYELLSHITIPYKSKNGNNSRYGFPKHRSCIFGLSKARKSGVIGLSNMSQLHEPIWDEILRIGDLICPFNFTSCYVNHNVICKKHVDKGNNGNSLIVSFGSYTGCNLVINDVKYDAYHQPIIFNGSQLVHYNTDDLNGNKYSLVFFNF